jgi:hypothetical protein
MSLKAMLKIIQPLLSTGLRFYDREKLMPKIIPVAGTVLRFGHKQALLAALSGAGA